MFTSSPSTFAPPFLTSSPPLSPPPLSPPSRTARTSTLISATTASCSFSNTCTEDPPRMQQISQIASLYEILGVPVGSTNHEIKSAYRRLARICHPDVAETSRKTSSADEFMKIHAAYCTLSDPEKRDVYDRRILHRRRNFTGGVSRFSSYGGRNWETDQCW